MDESDFKSKFSQGSEVLQRLFENGKSPLSGPFLRWKLWARWHEIIGPKVAAVTEPVGYQRGTLWIWVKNSSWMQQLVFTRDDFRQTINDKMGVHFVKNLRFTLDRREVPVQSDEQVELRNMLEKVTPASQDND